MYGCMYVEDELHQLTNSDDFSFWHNSLKCKDIGTVSLRGHNV